MVHWCELEPSRLPILPRSGLYLEAYGHGDDERFARLFAETWKQIPLWASRAMLRHWRSNHVHRFLACQSLVGKDSGGNQTIRLDRNGKPDFITPRVQLLYGWEPPSTGLVRATFTDADWEAEKAARQGQTLDERFPFACVSATGFLMRFWSPVVDRMPDNLVRDLIAHELAHVWQDATRGQSGCLTEYEEEDEADDLIQRWGFGDPELIDEWGANAGLAKIIKVASEHEALVHLLTHGDRYTPPAKP
jgi:hypothetical protein